MTAPFFFGVEIPQGVCGHMIDREGTPCGQEGFLHVAWAEDEDGLDHGFVCTLHVSILRRYPPLFANDMPQVHEVQPECLNRRALWSLELNCCYIPAFLPLGLGEHVEEPVAHDERVLTRSSP